MGVRSAGPLLLATFVGLLVCALSCEDARAQPSVASAPDREAEAKAYFLSGVELLSADNVEAALEQFLRSRAAFPRAKNTVNAAICLERLGRVDEALALYEIVRADFGVELDKGERDKLEPVIRALRAKVGSVRVRASAPGATVQVDGRPRGSAGEALWLLPGERTLRVVAPGHAPQRREIRVQAGATQEVDATLEPLTQVGVLRVEDAESAGADVFVDQVLVGQVPWEGVVATGRHLVTQRRGDRGSRPKAIVVIEGQTSAVALKSEILGPMVALSADPPSATLSLDGVALGGAWQGRLPRGRYVVRAEEPGYFPAERTLEVDARPASLAVTLSIDPEHARWPKAPRGELTLGAVAGLAVGSGLGSGAEATCPSACPEDNPALGYRVGARLTYRFPEGTAIEIGGGYGAATTSLLRDVVDHFDAAGASEAVHYQLAESTDLRMPFVGLGVSQAVRLVGPLRLMARVSAGVVVATVATSSEVSARTDGGATEAFLTPQAAESGPIAYLEPELGLELGVGSARLSAGLSALGLLGLTPAHGDRSLVVPPRPDPIDPGAVGNAPYSSAVARERSAGQVWLAVPQVGAGWAF